MLDSVLAVEIGDLGGADVVVEFSVPGSSAANVAYCIDRGRHVVVGTTGFGDTVAKIREAAEEVGLDPVACGLKVTGVLEVFALTVSGFRIVPILALAERRPGPVRPRASPA